MASRWTMGLRRDDRPHMCSWLTARRRERATRGPKMNDARAQKDALKSSPGPRLDSDAEDADEPACPITLLPMLAPHLLHGVAFEREALVEWIATRGMAVHPTTRVPLDESEVLRLEREANRRSGSLLRVAWSDATNPHYGADSEETLRSFLAHTLLQLADERKFAEAAHVLVQMHEYDSTFALATLARMDDAARRQLGATE
jgi:hypothetical protein